jgi:cellulose synthase/poly-beta-1,6-N-acetylglucosamine synthase-like glycosyltransferase
VILYDIFRYGHGVFFVALQTALMFGFFLEWLRDRRVCASGGVTESAGVPKSGAERPNVSVVIPIHNESRRMEGLLRSLLEQDYPAEIIFVDDRSTDESSAMLVRFVADAAERGMKDCRVITLKENPGPNHKQYALTRGIAGARGEYLLFTDGDCEVPPGWIRAMMRRMVDTGVGAVIGPVFKKKQGKGFFFLYQCYDHAVRYNYLAGAIGLGAAGGGFGNNLIISRKALDAAGGYEAVPPSPTEDAALISQIRSGGKYRVRAIALPDAAVETKAENSWKAFIAQTLRWNNGGVFSPEPLTRFNFNLLMLVISTGILAIPLLPFFPGLWPMPAGVFIVMIENTIAAFGLFRSKLPKGGVLLTLGYFAALLFTPLYFTLMTIMGYCRIKVMWKGDQIPVIRQYGEEPTQRRRP